MNKKYKYSSNSSKKKSGNTIQISPSIHWCFTFNNYNKEDISVLVPILDSLCNKYIFQEEVCPETKSPHLQGYVAFKIKKRPVGLFPNAKMHWEKCRLVKESIKYCQKEDTRPVDGRIWRKGINIIKKLKCITKLSDWQQQLEKELLIDADDRKVNWFWSEQGATGKSAFARYMCIKHQAIVVGGAASDIKYAITQLVLDDNPPNIVIIDIPRVSLNIVSYKAIEEIKNGLFFNTKYESKMVIFNPPHILVLANAPPEEEHLSADRWAIKCLD